LILRLALGSATLPQCTTSRSPHSRASHFYTARARS